MIAPTYQLSMRSGPKPGMTFPLEQEETLVGRDLANDIPISDAEVSRRHARFILQDDTVFIEDLGSTNGTFLNGERISTPKQLRAGDVITLGESIVMVFEKATYDPDATVVSPHIEQPDFEEPMPEPEPYYAAEQEPDLMYQPESFPESPVEQAPIPAKRAKKEKKGGLPTWLVILIIAIVVVLCVIAVTLWLMPASWWCAITFDMLEGCPIP